MIPCNNAFTKRSELKSPLHDLVLTGNKNLDATGVPTRNYTGKAQKLQEVPGRMCVIRAPASTSCYLLYEELYAILSVS